ncbi:MAG: hypothetical protein ACK2T3_01815, partial [Candidatus Promineifilaceae bacterium]
KIGITAGRNVHVQSRELFHPPTESPRAQRDVPCSLTAVTCPIGEWMSGVYELLSTQGYRTPILSTGIYWD